MEDVALDVVTDDAVLDRLLEIVVDAELVLEALVDQVIEEEWPNPVVLDTLLLGSEDDAYELE